MVKFDDLGGIEVGSGECREPDHEHRADGEVRHDHRVGAGLLEARAERFEILCVEATCPHDRVHVIGGAPQKVLSGRVGVGEVNRNFGVGIDEFVSGARYLHAGTFDAESV